MDLYFRPLACSMATRIALYEAGAQARFLEVDKATGTAADGAAFQDINPIRQVPALRTDDGELLTENAAILQHVADCFPGSGLAPAGGIERVRLQQWLSFIGTELHKVVFIPLLERGLDDSVRHYARSKAPARLGRVDQHLAGRDFLLDRFTVADAYLVTVMNWAPYAGLELAAYPALAAYLARQGERPSVARALAEERALYQQELARTKAA